MKILHVVPDLQPSAFTRELQLLLASETATAQVCNLGTGNRWLDPWPLWSLAQRIRAFQPDVIHACGVPALRAARLSTRHAAIVVSHPLRRGHASRLDRWLLGSAAAILVTGAAEARRCRAAGLPAAKLRLVPPGVALPPMDRTLGSVSSPSIVCVGALEPDKGFHDAVWTFDILHFVDRELELFLVGEGPERPRLESFARQIGLSHRIHFLGGQAEPAAALARASIVWVPSRKDTGAGVALEAMAAGRPVIAARWPTLAEIVTDGDTGFLVDPGDKMALARQTLLLLRDAKLRQQLGAAGRRHVELQFCPERFRQAWFAHCSDLAA
jgi:glycosyltransferase involved in cell wall biosynthesis